MNEQEFVEEFSTRMVAMVRTIIWRTALWVMVATVIGSCSGKLIALGLLQ